MEKAFRLVSPAVYSVESSANGSDEESTNWVVGIAPVTEDQGGYSSRFVMGTLSASSASGSGRVLVLGYVQQLVGDDLELSDFKSEQAIETLYDYAQPLLNSALGMIGSSIKLPLKSPDPELSFLVKVDELDDDMEADAG